MSSLRRDKYKVYFLDLRESGVRRRVSLKTTDVRIARIRRKQVERELLGSSAIKPLSLKEFEEEFLEYSRSRKSAATTEKEQATFRLLEKYMKVRTIDKLDRKSADLFITAVSKNLAPASVNSYLAAIRSIFGTAKEWGYINVNPFSGVKGVIEEEKPARILTMDEIHVIFEATLRVAPQFYDLFVFYLFTGCRRTEALRLEWEDIDFTERTILFRSTKSTVRRRKKMRKMLMSPVIHTILSARRHYPRPFDYKEHRISENFRNIADYCRIPDVSLHNLRMTFSSYSQDIGMPRGFVSWLIGHTDERITQTEYTGFYADMISNYLSKLETKIIPMLPKSSLPISGQSVQRRRSETNADER